MDNRQEKIQMLSRINRARAATPPFLAGLSEALGELVGTSALVSPENTNALMEAFRSGYQSAIKDSAVSYRRFFLPSERSIVLCLADCFADRLPTEEVFFLSKLGKDCVAVCLTISVLLRHTASVIRLDGDSLSALSKDHTQGVLIDHNPDDPEQAYEITAWGDRWPMLILACDQR